MIIRRATSKDIEGIGHLLTQVCLVHHNGRPDLFQHGKRKYTSSELKELLTDESRPVFVAVSENGTILAHAFCVHQEYVSHNVLTDIKTLYIDDICVLDTCRGKRIGKEMYRTIYEYAKEKDYYNITLNVWSFNEKALKFYESCGFLPQKIGMEVIL